MVDGGSISAVIWPGLLLGHCSVCARSGVRESGVLCCCPSHKDRLSDNGLLMAIEVEVEAR